MLKRAKLTGVEEFGNHAIFSRSANNEQLGDAKFTPAVQDSSIQCLAVKSKISSQPDTKSAQYTVV